MHKPYEFGVKVSVATTLKRSRGGQFVAHIKALAAIAGVGEDLGEADADGLLDRGEDGGQRVAVIGI